MDVNSIVLFLHIVGALGIFVALGLEWTGLWQIRKMQRVQAVTQAVSQGASMSEVMTQFQISRRTFFRDRGGSG